MNATHPGLPEPIHPGAGSGLPETQARRSVHPAWILGAGLLVLLGARFSQHLPIPLPACGLRTLTGIPCPLCGSTRTLAAWSHLDAGQAFRLNPLVAGACVALATWLVLAWLDRWTSRNWARTAMGRLQRKPWPMILALMAAANWVYLMFCLPE